MGFAPLSTSYANGDVLTAANVNGITGTVNGLGNLAVNAQTGTTYTLALSDSGTIVTLTNASAITLTVPTNASVAFPVGTQIILVQGNAGQVTIAGAGVTFWSNGTKQKLAGQYAAASIVKIATDTWVVAGNVSA